VACTTIRSTTSAIHSITPASPSSADLKIIEIAKTTPDALDMLFRGDEMPANFPYKDTIAELEALLEDPEKDFSQFEDYRNFYTFEIHMQDVVSGRTTRWETRRGTGSGAEQQVPIYVAIGASLASVYGSSSAAPASPPAWRLRYSTRRSPRWTARTSAR
jgi:hypothetical protein